MFTRKRTHFIPNLKATFEEYAHPSGAKHYHLRTDSTENCFVVALPTLPDTDDGRAHILEHLALCGSKKYPTRDPFFAMTRRSLATFMNAMTYPDKTAYPFASTDKQDFFNLLGVYLDAVFFPNLDYLDFRQEGWRHEIDPQGDLTYQGVVYNEMKGATESRDYHMWHAMEAALKPQTTYASHSGGDPVSIPELSYEQLKEFHRTHYHPSLALFMSYGDIPPEDIQQFIEKNVMAELPERLEPMFAQNSTLTHKNVLQTVPVPSTADIAHSEHAFSINWLIGQSASDLADDYQIFAQILLADGSPFSNKLASAGFGRPSSMMGFSNHSKEACLHLGMEGLSSEQVSQGIDLIYQQLALVAQEGFDAMSIQAALRDLELSIKNTSSGRMPYGLSLLLHSMQLAFHGEDPMRALDAEPVLEQARVRFANPQYVKTLALQLLQEHFPKVTQHFVPDSAFFEKRKQTESQVLQEASRTLTAEQKQQILQEQNALLERQNKAHDFSCLPKIAPDSVARTVSKPYEVQCFNTTSAPSITFVEAPTNGVSSLQVWMDVSHITLQDLPYLNLLCSLLPQIGEEGRNWQQALQYRNLNSSSYDCNLSVHNAKESSDLARLNVCFSTMGLDREIHSALPVLSNMILRARFDDVARLQFLIDSGLNEMIQSITDMGPSIASMGAQSAFSATSSLQQRVSGTQRLAFVNNVKKMLQSAQGTAALLNRLSDVLKFVQAAPTTIVAIGSHATLEAAKSLQGQLEGLHPLQNFTFGTLHIPSTGAHRKLAVSAAGNVNYCHLALQTVGYLDPSSPYLSLYGQLLSNERLHRALREQGGAYGASANYTALNGLMSMSTYRDPNFENTYAEFEKAVHWGFTHAFTPAALDDAKISIIQNLDKPSSPKNEALFSLKMHMMGISQKMREERKAAILDASLTDIQNAAKEHLGKSLTSASAFIAQHHATRAQELGFEHQEAMSVLSEE